MKLKNPFAHESLTQRVEHTVLDAEHQVEAAIKSHLPHHHSPYEKALAHASHIFFYLSLFVGGFVAAKIHTLLTLT